MARTTRRVGAGRPHATQRPKPFRLGFCTYNQPDFPVVASLGAKYIRTDNPNATKIGQIRAAGCDVIPIARYTIGELAGSPSQGTIDAWVAGKLALWTGVSPPPPVIEFVNEPWNAGYSDFTTNYALYIQILTSFVTQIWAQWPSMRVLVCGDTGPVAGWLDAVLAADTAKIHADSRIRPSVHNYVEARTPESLSGGAQYMFRRYESTYAKFKAFGHPNPRVWVTEFGWESDTVGGVVSTTAVTEALQSDYTIRGLDIMKASGIVETACVFGMMQGTTPAYNVKRPDGHALGSQSLKPVCAALTAYPHGKL